MPSSFLTSFFTFSLALHCTSWSWLSVNLQVEALRRDLFSPEDGKVKPFDDLPASIMDSFLGVGIAMIINSILGTLYYNVIIAWALFYFVLSFRKRLLWADCGYWWNTDQCFVPSSSRNLFIENGTTWNCTNVEFANFSDYGCQPINTTGKVTATEEFF